jgi:predicted nucleic acid-binding protein
MAEILVFDTSGWIALDEKEPGAEQVESLLADAWLGKAQIGASFVTLTELEYIRTQEHGAQQAAELLAFARSQPVTWHHSDDALCSAAAKLKAAYKVSFADSFVAALAQRLNATLVHKDPEFEALKGVIKLLPRPPKTSTAPAPPSNSAHERQ